MHHVILLFLSNHQSLITMERNEILNKIKQIMKNNLENIHAISIDTLSDPDLENVLYAIGMVLFQTKGNVKDCDVMEAIDKQTIGDLKIFYNIECQFCSHYGVISYVKSEKGVSHTVYICEKCLGERCNEDMI
jgi:hypothetical protein